MRLPAMPSALRLPDYLSRKRWQRWLWAHVGDEAGTEDARLHDLMAEHANGPRLEVTILGTRI